MFLYSLLNVPIDLVDQWVNVEQKFKVLLRDYNLETILAGFPSGVGSAWVSEITEFKEIDIDDVRALDNNNKLITVTIKIKANCSIDSNWEDFVDYPEVQEFWGESMDEFSWVYTIQENSINLIVKNK